MQCANPHCRRPADDIESGTLAFVEMEVSPEERTTRSDSGFPVCSVQGRFFWLCSQCSLTLKIRRWTHAGLVVEERAKDGQAQVWSTDAKFPARRVPSRQEPPALLPKALRHLRSCDNS